MRRNGVIFIVVLVALLVAVGYSADFSNANSSEDNLIRFHVIANSDTPEDQQIKRKVRDAILEAIGDEFEGTSDIEQARKLAASYLNTMERIAEKEIAASGKGYGAKAEIGYFDFPTKTYGTFSLPAGNYEAVRVVLGEGKGENWWCVLFPPLCFVDISNSVAREPEVAKVSKQFSIEIGERDDTVTGTAEKKPKVELRFKLLEVFGRSEDFVADSGSGKGSF